MGGTGKSKVQTGRCLKDVEFVVLKLCIKWCTVGRIETGGIVNNCAAKELVKTERNNNGYKMY